MQQGPGYWEFEPANQKSDRNGLYEKFVARVSREEKPPGNEITLFLMVMILKMLYHG